MKPGFNNRLDTKWTNCSRASLKEIKGCGTKVMSSPMINDGLPAEDTCLPDCLTISHFPIVPWDISPKFKLIIEISLFPSH